MKLRGGFVSNSSSSSFVLITTVEEWERVKQEAHPWRIAVAEAMMSGPVEAFGQQLVKFSEWSSHGGSSMEYIDIDIDYDGDKPEGDYDGKESAWEAWEAIQGMFTEGAYVTHSEDW